MRTRTSTATLTILTKLIYNCIVYLNAIGVNEAPHPHVISAFGFSVTTNDFLTISST
jgi:hypothetical protein